MCCEKFSEIKILRYLAYCDLYNDTNEDLTMLLNLWFVDYDFTNIRQETRSFSNKTDILSVQLKDLIHYIIAAVDQL